jgi:hypothetical protein
MSKSTDPDPVGCIRGDLDNEEWREYDFGGRVYRIEKPDRVYYRVGGSTHRVVDSAGIVHCVPAPGVNGCVMRWRTPSGVPDVTW